MPSDNKLYTLPPLPYAFDALEPYIDAKTMEIHHDKHHQAYINNLNKALEMHPQFQSKSLEELVIDWQSLPEDIRTTVRNNGGGHYNHTLFWTYMMPKSSGKPREKMASEIQKQFKSFDEFQKQFNAKAMGVFGSGWAWLCLNKKGLLEVISTPNQDNPLTNGLKPLLGLDVWEHAYYLKYQNQRVSYVDAWWHVVNWDQVEESYRSLV
jgi:Fe-Mn family superoxide dismutase